MDRADARAASDDWNRHWDSFGDVTAAGPAKEFRHRLVTDLLASSGPPRRVVDLGSGGGELAARIHARFPAAEILGLELSEVGVQRSRELVPRATFVERDLLVPREPEEGFRSWATHAVCSEVLEHLDEPDVLLGNALPYLEPGCRLIVTVPGGPMSAFDRHIGHRRHFTVAALRALLERAGLSVLSVRGAGFPFFNLYRLAVVARGSRLTADVAREGAGPSPLVRAGMTVFRPLLRVPSTWTNRGWQLVALAELPRQRQ